MMKNLSMLCLETGEGKRRFGDLASKTARDLAKTRERVLSPRGPASADHPRSAGQENPTQGLIVEGSNGEEGGKDAGERDVPSLPPGQSASRVALGSHPHVYPLYPERLSPTLTTTGNNNTGTALTNSLIKASEPVVEGRGKRLPVLSLSPREQELLAGVLDTPGAHCNDCPISGQCSEFLPGAECSIAPRFDGLSMRDPNNQVTRAVIIADMQFKRGMQAATVEQTKHPGVLEPMVTRQLEVAALADQRVRDLIAPPVPTSGGTTTLSLSQTTAPGTPAPDVLGAAIKAIVANRPKEPTTITVDKDETSG